MFIHALPKQIWNTSSGGEWVPHFEKTTRENWSWGGEINKCRQYYPLKIRTKILIEQITRLNKCYLWARCYDRPSRKPNKNKTDNNHTYFLQSQLQRYQLKSFK